MKGTFAAFALLLPTIAQAALFHGETLDLVADYVSWGALVIVPVVAISVFWLVHILPEKIAEKRKHPQTKAIQITCLLSLAFGGMLWPIALLWATTRPVLHKMAYGTDVWDEDPHKPSGEADRPEPVPTLVAEVPGENLQEELQRLREQVERLGRRLPTAQEIEASANPASIRVAAQGRDPGQGG